MSGSRGVRRPRRGAASTACASRRRARPAPAGRPNPGSRRGSRAASTRRSSSARYRRSRIVRSSRTRASARRSTSTESSRSSARPSFGPSSNAPRTESLEQHLGVADVAELAAERASGPRGGRRPTARSSTWRERPQVRPQPPRRDARLVHGLVVVPEANAGVVLDQAGDRARDRRPGRPARRSTPRRARRPRSRARRRAAPSARSSFGVGSTAPAPARWSRATIRSAARASASVASSTSSSRKCRATRSSASGGTIVAGVDRRAADLHGVVRDGARPRRRSRRRARSTAGSSAASRAAPFAPDERGDEVEGLARDRRGSSPSKTCSRSHERRPVHRRAGSFTVQPSPVRCRRLTPHRRSRWSGVSRYVVTVRSPGSTRPAARRRFRSGQAEPVGGPQLDLALDVHDVARAFDRELLQPLLGVDATLGRHLRPRPVAPERPREDVVREATGRAPRRAAPGAPRSVDGNHGLHAAVEVALHQVGRPDVVRRVPVAARTGRPASARGIARRSSAPGSARTVPGPRGAGSRCRGRSGRSRRRPPEASYSASIISGSTSAVHLQHDPPALVRLPEDELAASWDGARAARRAARRYSSWRL